MYTPWTADPPYIKHVSNVSTYIDSDSTGKSALLKCEVENTEPGLKMYVKWIPLNDTVAETVKLRDKDMFFLYLYNISRDNELVYECWLYSEHCPDKPVDKKSAVITGESLAMYTNVGTPYKLKLSSLQKPPAHHLQRVR